MKILSLHVYGYGKIVDKVIDTNMQFIQVYGENEAGKSTTQSFIHSILFGFPKRSDAEPRREPRMHNMYGGKLVVQFDDEQGPVEIERVKGKVQGDLKVYMSDGTQKSEEWLKKKLNYIDKKTFRSIFSFDVLGLQDIHTNMTEDKLQEYLLRAGALGSHEYDEMLQAIDKELATIYKKNGVNPELNREVEDIKDLNARIRDLEKNESRYTMLINDRIKTQENLAHKKDAVNQLTMIHKQKIKEIMYHPEIREWKFLESQMADEPAIFPEKGIERYIALKSKVDQSVQDIGLRNEKLKKLKEEMMSIQLPNEADISFLENVSKKEHEFNQKTAEVEKLRAETESLKSDIEMIKKDIGWTDDHLDVDDSNVMKDEVQRKLTELNEVMLEEQYLVKEIDLLSSEIRGLTNEIKALEDEQISEDRINVKKELLDKEYELKEKERMYKVIRGDYDKEKRERNRSRRLLSMVIMAISAILLLGGAFYLFNGVTLLGGILLALGIVGLVVFFVANKPEKDALNLDYEDDVKELKDAIKQLKDNNKLDFDLTDARTLKMDLKAQKLKKVNLGSKLEEMKDSLSGKEAIKDQLNNELFEIKSALKVNENMDNKLIVDAIHAIRLVKQKRSRLDAISKETDEILNYKTQLAESLSPKLESLGIHYDENNVFYEVGDKLKALINNKTHYDRLNDQNELLENEMDVLNEQNSASRIEIRDLFNVVDADDEEEYYYYARQFDDYSNKKIRFEELTNKLNQENFTYDVRTQLSDMILADLKMEEEDVSQQIEVFNAQIHDEQNLLAMLNSEIKTLESDGKLSELNHLYHLRQNRIQNLSEDYMSLMYIKVLIESHIKSVKDERLPVVVEEARAIFEYLTRGRYNNVSYDEKGGLRVRHSNGQIFTPSELSQSTKEMLYISLRLSLIKALKGYYQLPLIIDDAFVHFDKDRRRIILEFLKNEFQDQVLYFTCNLDTQIPSSQTIKLKEKV